MILEQAVELATEFGSFDAHYMPRWWMLLLALLAQVRAGLET